MTTAGQPNLVATLTATRESRSLSWAVVSAGSVLAVLVVWLYAGVVAGMARQWWQDPNWSHGFAVPAFSAFLLWRGRGRWRAAVVRPSLLGLAGIAASLALLVAGSLGAELFTTRFSLVMMLGSLVVYVAGWRALRAVAFPLGYLLLMIPWPAIVYAQATLPLQLLASRLAAAALELVRVPVLREGNLLVLANRTLEVADACSGIRSLVSLVTLAAAYGYLAEQRWWLRVALAGLMVPIAVVSNAARIFGTGVLTYAVSPRLAEGFFHEFSGWLIFLTAAALMAALHAMLRPLARWAEPTGG
ncbi:MAG TPA: exosortase/archaeosortase family protein [Candidatus Acidoferrales bacterium]|nr:exosortase/archaeosortase family protein [Candidatus Acidoferrales bacterium]